MIGNLHSASNLNREKRSVRVCVEGSCMAGPYDAHISGYTAIKAE